MSGTVSIGVEKSIKPEWSTMSGGVTSGGKQSFSGIGIAGWANREDQHHQPRQHPRPGKVGFEGQRPTKSSIVYLGSDSRHWGLNNFDGVVPEVTGPVSHISSILRSRPGHQTSRGIDPRYC